MGLDLEDSISMVALKSIASTRWNTTVDKLAINVNLSPEPELIKSQLSSSSRSVVDLRVFYV